MPVQWSKFMQGAKVIVHACMLVIAHAYARNDMHACTCYDRSICMYYDQSTCMYYELTSCMHYEHSTCTYLNPRACMHFDHSTCTWYGSCSTKLRTKVQAAKPLGKQGRIAASSPNDSTLSVRIYQKVQKTRTCNAVFRSMMWVILTDMNKNLSRQIVYG